MSSVIVKPTCEVRESILGGIVRYNNKRGERPKDRVKIAFKEDPKKCPFCPYNKELLTEEVLRSGKTRCVYNKYPTYGKGSPVVSGTQYVVIEGPDHTELHLRPQKEVVDYLHAIQQLHKIAFENQSTRFVFPFKGKGATSGASIAHPHTQIYTMDSLLGFEIVKKIEESSKAGCKFCKMHTKEQKIRVYQQNSQFYSSVPYAAQFYYETWILPIRHLRSILSLSDKAIGQLAAILKSTLAAIDKASKGADTTLEFISAHRNARAFHFHIQIQPCLSFDGGPEKFTRNLKQMVMLPEEMAQELRVASLQA